MFAGLEIYLICRDRLATAAIPLSFEPFSYTNFTGTNYRTAWYTKTNTSISSLILQLRYDNNRDTIKIALHSFQGR